MQEIQQKEKKNKFIRAKYNKALKVLNSKELSAIPENFTALNNKIALLKSAIHIVKTLSVKGYIKYIQINES